MFKMFLAAVAAFAIGTGLANPNLYPVEVQSVVAWIGARAGLTPNEWLMAAAWLAFAWVITSGRTARPALRFLALALLCLVAAILVANDLQGVADLARVTGVPAARLAHFLDVGCGAMLAAFVISMLGRWRGNKQAVAAKPAAQPATKQEPEPNQGFVSAGRALEPGDVCVFKSGPSDVEMTVVRTFGDGGVVPVEYTGRLASGGGMPFRVVRVAYRKGGVEYGTAIVPSRMLMIGRADEPEEPSVEPDVGDTCVLKSDPNSRVFTLVTKWDDVDEVPSDYNGDTDDDGSMPWMPARVSYLHERGEPATAIVPLRALRLIDMPLRTIDRPVAERVTEAVAAAVGTFDALEALHAERDQAMRALEDAKKKGDFAEAGRLLYKVVPDIDARILEATRGCGGDHLAAAE